MSALSFALKTRGRLAAFGTGLQSRCRIADAAGEKADDGRALSQSPFPFFETHAGILASAQFIVRSHDGCGLISDTIKIGRHSLQL